MNASPRQRDWGGSGRPRDSDSSASDAGSSDSGFSDPTSLHQQPRADRPFKTGKKAYTIICDWLILQQRGACLVCVDRCGVLYCRFSAVRCPPSPSCGTPSEGVRGTDLHRSLHRTVPCLHQPLDERGDQRRMRDRLGLPPAGASSLRSPSGWCRLASV